MAVANYRRLYARPRASALFRLALDAWRAPTPLRRQAVLNRLGDYSRCLGDTARFDLHRRLEALRVVAGSESYDYGEGYYYQSSPTAGITGFRDTAARVAAYDLFRRLDGRQVLDIGCNAGFLTTEIAATARSIVAIEPSPHLIAIAREVALFAGRTNTSFHDTTFEGFEPPAPVDAVVAFANHETIDGRSTFDLGAYLGQCHKLCAPNGLLLFESHPQSIDRPFDELVERIQTAGWQIEQRAEPLYGTFLDRDRVYVVARKS